jgi:hypothetical protein
MAQNTYSAGLADLSQGWWFSASWDRSFSGVRDLETTDFRSKKYLRTRLQTATLKASPFRQPCPRSVPFGGTGVDPKTETEIMVTVLEKENACHKGRSRLRMHRS